MYMYACHKVIGCTIVSQDNSLLDSYRYRTYCASLVPPISVIFQNFLSCVYDVFMEPILYFPG